MLNKGTQSILIKNAQLRRQHRDRLRRRLLVLPTYLLLGIFSMSALLAMIWAVLMSLRPNQELFTYGAWALPRTWAWKNYAEAWKQMRVGIYFINTVIYSVVGTLGAVILAACTAYVLARIQFPGRRIFRCV